MMITKKTDLPKLLLFQPRYLAGSGDSTELVTLTGQVLADKRGVRSVRTALCRQYAVDYVALRRICRELCGPGLSPLLLLPGYTLVAVKTRLALVSGDPCYGYVNLAEITAVREIDQGEYQAEIKIGSEQYLQVLTTVKTVEQNLRRAKMIEKLHWSGEQTDPNSPLRQELLGLLLKKVLEK